MKCLLDTCAILWAVAAPEHLSEEAKTVLNDPKTQVFVSPISVAELACGVERNKIALTEHWKPWSRKYISLNNWNVEPISLEIMEEAYSLAPPFHRDPADRIIVSTARMIRGSVITADRKILDYPHVDTIW